MSGETVNKLGMLMTYNKQISEYYNLLLQYELGNAEQKCNYSLIGNKMKEIIEKEEKIYNNLGVRELNEMIHFISDGVGISGERQRMFYHLTDMLQRLLMANIIFLDNEYSIDEANYLSMVDSKVDVESLTRIDTMIETTDGIDNKSYDELLKYWTLSKFVRLSRNSYIEKLAIDKDFDVHRIEIPSFNDIKENLSNEEIDAIEYKYVMAIKGELDALSTLDRDDCDPIVKTYTAMTALINIEIRLDALSMNSLDEIKKHYINKYGNNNNEQMRYAKNLILKKEE